MRIDGFLLVAAISITTPVNAELCEHIGQQINGFSAHYGEKEVTRTLNGVNPGIGVVCSHNKSTSVSIGIFSNSYRKESRYLSITKSAIYGDTLRASAGLSVMAADGYSEDKFTGPYVNGVAIIGIAAFSIGYKDAAKINVGYVPERLLDKANGTDIVMFNLELSLAK